MKKIKTTPKQEHDQNFLIDTRIIQDVIKAIETEISSKKSPHFNSTLEIGPGTGAITKELALLSKKVVAVEIDKSLSIALSSLPKSVTIEYGDALEYLKNLKQKIKQKIHNKKDGTEKSTSSLDSSSSFPFDLVFSSLPYKICEPTLKALSIMPGFNVGFFIVPLGFYKKIKESVYFESFFKTTHIFDIPKESFNPTPKSDSCLIKLTKKEFLKPQLSLAKKSNIKVHSTQACANFIIQKFLLQRTKKAKNALRDAIIDFSKLKGYDYSTKKQAELLILKLGLSSKILETNVYSLSQKELKTIKKRITKEPLISNH